MIIQNNILAMNSQRQYKINTDIKCKSTEKLSSGYKINRAADDAASLTISEKMRSQIRGLIQASKNAQDGISCVQTAEGALNEVHDMLHRMNELSINAANGTNTIEDRNAIQKEMEQLIFEIDRVSDSTEFNQIQLLKGNGDARIISDGWMKPYDTMGLKGTIDEETGLFTLDSSVINKGGNKIVLDGEEYIMMGEAPVSYTLPSSREISAFEYNGNDKWCTFDFDGANVSGHGYLMFSIEDTDLILEVNDQDDGIKICDAMFMALSRQRIERFNNNTLTVFSTTDTSAVFLWDVSGDAVNHAKELVGTSFSMGRPLGYKNYVDPEQASWLIEAALKKHNGSAVYNGDGTYTLTKLSGTTDRYVHDPKQIDIFAGASNNPSNIISISIDPISADDLGISGIDVSDNTGTGAKEAIAVIERASDKVSSIRSYLGAMQNRIEHTIKNLDNVVENTQSAESYIRDTDMAEEMVKLSKQNVLMQVGEAMISQANQNPQGILSLLS